MAGPRGEVSLDPEKWRAGAEAFRELSEQAFARAPGAEDAFDGFAPDPEGWSCWLPFLWELESRSVSLAKIQIAGPLTCQWVLRFSEGSSPETHSEVATAVLRLVLARALAMVRALRHRGVQALVFVDEPGLYGLSSGTPRHRMAMQELGIFLSGLRQEGALVGLHCCSNTDWVSALSLPLDVLSFDTRLSLSVLLEDPLAVAKFVERGGRFGFGVIPTSLEGRPASLGAEHLASTLVETVHERMGEEAVARRMLTQGIYTPACGLALHGVAEAEAIGARLRDVTARIARLSET